MEVVKWTEGKIRILDQTRLPADEVYLDLSTYQEVGAAIKEMKVRGAPIIGIVAAYGLALGAFGLSTNRQQEFVDGVIDIARSLLATRPTAVNLFQAIERMTAVLHNGPDPELVRQALLEEARQIHKDEEDNTVIISNLGAELIEDGYTILTHCNAGALATSGDHGTALGAIKAAHLKGKQIKVFANETRPLLQGSRLTAWELLRAGIDTTLITDSMAGHFMSQSAIDCVVVGADRIAANGDVANKIGTYSLAVLARANRVPFYVAAPTTTIDMSTRSGKLIPIEYRSPDEVTLFHGVQTAPEDIKAANPAFDVTPNRYVTAIITEKGIARRPYRQSLSQLRPARPLSVEAQIEGGPRG